MKFATGRIALAVRSRALGLAAGMPMDKIVKSFENGNGCTLGHIAVVVGLGTMLGKAAQFVGSAGAQGAPGLSSASNASNASIASGVTPAAARRELPSGGDNFIRSTHFSVC